MDGPGMSLFQGADSIKLSSDIQREEEEEFLEEEKQRKAELKNLFENAFDDLNDDDEDDVSTVNSSHYSIPNENGLEFHNMPNYEDTRNSSFNQSGFPQEVNYQGQIYPPQNMKGSRFENNQINFGGGGDPEISSHYQHCFRTSPGYQQPIEINRPTLYKNTEAESMEQLQILYEVRLREIERLNQELEAEKESKQKVLRKLAVAEAEKEGTLQSCVQGQELLFSSKEKISELENELAGLKDELNGLEKVKHESSKELEIAQLQILNLKQTMETMERCDVNMNREKQMDAMINTLNTKHKKEIISLQQQLDAAVAKYNKKDLDCNALEIKLEELERKHSALLLNKCDSATRQDSTVQALLEDSNKERLELNKKLLSLQAECDMLRSDLEQYDNVSRFRLLGNSSSDEHDTDSIRHLGISRHRTDPRRPTSSVVQSDIANKLKDELHRALVGQKAKRNEIRKLQEQVRNKELQIHEMKEKERVYLGETESLKGDMARIMLQLQKESDRSVSNEKEEIIVNLRSRVHHLETENKKNMDRIRELELEIEKLNEELKEESLSKKRQGEDYLGYHDSEVAKVKKETSESLKQKELEWNAKLEYLMKECDEVKQLYLEVHGTKEKIAKLLEEEKEKFNSLSKERDEIKTHLSIKEIEMTKLEKTVDSLKKEKQIIDEQLKKNSSNSSSEHSRIISLEAEVERLQNELLELPKKQTLELEGLKNELGLAKTRLIELEKELRVEFASEKAKIVSENSTLRESIREKEVEIKRLQSTLVKPPINKTDASAMTEVVEDNISTQRINQELNEQGRTAYSEKAEDIRKLEEKCQRQMNKELKELEVELSEKHKTELAATEERVKNLTIKYFTEEMRKLEMKHKMEIQAFIEKERLIVEELKKALIEKQNEIKLLSQNDSQEQLMLLKKKMDEDRNKAAEIMAHWAKEVQDMKVQLGESQKEVNELRNKWNSARKAARVYKKRLMEHRTKQTEKYKNMLTEIQSRVDAIVTAKEEQVEETLQRIEQEYQKKERALREKLEKKIKR